MTYAERYAKLKAEHRCVDCKIQLSASNKFTKANEGGERGEHKRNRKNARKAAGTALRARRKVNRNR